MIRPSGILKNSSIFFSFSLLNYIARFLISILIARSLGPDGKGAYTLLITTASLLVLFVNLGLNGAFTYLTASQKIAPGSLARFSIWVSGILGLVGIVVFYGLYITVLANTFLEGIATNLIILILVLLPINLFTSFLASILLGLQQIAQYNLVDTFRIWSNLLLQIIALLSGTGLPGAMAAWAISNLLAMVLAVYYLKRQTLEHQNKLRSIIKPSFAYGFKSYLANLLTFFNYRLDSYMVNLFINPQAVGIYSTGVGAAELLWYVPNSISSALFPKIPTLDRSTASQLTARICRLTSLVIIPLACLYAVAGFFLIPIIYGDPFSPSVVPFLLLLPGIIAIAFSKLLSADLSGRGKPQYATASSAITVIATLLLDIALIPQYGIPGAAVASSIAYIISAICLLVFFNRETGIPFRMCIAPTKPDIMTMRNLFTEKLKIHR